MSRPSGMMFEEDEVDDDDDVFGLYNRIPRSALPVRM